MPKVAAKKAAPAAAGKKAAAAAKKSKLYNMPEKIKEGTVLTDRMKTEWKIGPSIGTGGFGEIYSASKTGENKYDYVVKCVSNGMVMKLFGMYAAQSLVYFLGTPRKWTPLCGNAFLYA